MAIDFDKFLIRAARRKRYPSADPGLIVLVGIARLARRFRVWPLIVSAVSILAPYGGTIIDGQFAGSRGIRTAMPRQAVERQHRRLLWRRSSLTHATFITAFAPALKVAR